jgi:FkbM family methyltransferase
MATQDEVKWKQTAAELRQRMDRIHRSVLEKDVLQALLPLRAAAISRRAALPETAERERRFGSTSRAYAAAVDDPEAMGGQIRRIDVDGLTWSVPLLHPGDADRVTRAIGHQDFPYRVITQTREVAIGGIMIDLGANVGRMSIPRVVLGDVAAAYCAEPDPLNYACLVRNVIDNGLRGLVLPDRVAIGAQTGTVRFERSRTSGGHRVIAASEVTARETIDVAMISLDDWIDSLGIDANLVNFVKVDVQGSEVGVLTGAARLLAHRHIAWQMEVDPHLLRATGSSVTDLFALVQRHFTHFVDLHREGVGERVRPTTELLEALAYMSGDREARTDILMCTLAPRGGS